jgi:2,4-didehydro-3-deoxy-L-rhamnonate hydrolase
VRLANLAGRATLVVPGDDDLGVDIAEVSGGKFGPDVQGLHEEWDALRAFVADLDLRTSHRAR